MKILLAGGSGFIGKALKKKLIENNHEVKTLTHDPRKVFEDQFFWDPQKKILDLALLKEIDVVINLSGKNISSHYWTSSEKKSLIQSRLEPADFLVKEIQKLQKPPSLWINASAIGFYGSRGEELLDENSSQGEGFLADLCKEWEGVLDPLSKLGTRVVKARFGVVLGKEGGILKKLLPLFKYGLGAKIGYGSLFMSWIALEDAVDALIHIMGHTSLKGAVNIVSPNPVSNEIFTKTLGKVLERPTFFRVPETVIKLFLGEMGKEVLLSSLRVDPKALTLSHFQFHYPHLEGALKHILKFKG